MKYQLVLRDKAVNELRNAYSWYETQQKGLGEKFLKTVRDYLAIILKNPDSFKTSYKNFKEVWIKKFPYHIVYFIDAKKNKIVIFSVFHTSQNPKKKFRS